MVYRVMALYISGGGRLTALPTPLPSGRGTCWPCSQTKEIVHHTCSIVHPRVGIFVCFILILMPRVLGGTLHTVHAPEIFVG